MKKALFFILFCISFSVINAQALQSVESVEYDASQNRFFVSNSSSIIQRNSNGTLEYFGTGAASFGMEVLGNTLFVIQGSAVRGYDLTSENQVMSVNIPGASFLNGMTNNGVDKIYVTDFGANKVHEVNISDMVNPVVTEIVSNTGATPNGIVYDGINNRLVFVTWGAGSVRAIDLTSFAVSTLTSTPYSNIDGIDEDNDGNYYISYWSTGSHISKYDADFANAPETITVSGLSNPADICYAKEIDTLAIPHSGNQVTFLSFVPEDTVSTDGINEVLNQKINLSVFPNPVTENSRISFTLEKTSEVNLSVFDLQGKLIFTLMNGNQVYGKHQVLLTGVDLPIGISVVNLTVNGELTTFNILKE